MKPGRRNYARGPASYQRGKPRIEPSGKAFLIVTEGEKTEPNYLKAVRNKLGLSAVDVEIVHPEGTDPLTLVREAIRLRDERNALADTSLTTVAYDEVWVVFDLEQTHGDARRLAVQAETLRKAQSLAFAISDPCFEYWLLLHYEYTTSTFKDCAAVIRRLKKHWQDYSKDGTPPADMLANLPKAIANARLRHKNQLAPYQPEHPFTDVDLLVSGMNSATRPHLRYDITPP